MANHSSDPATKKVKYIASIIYLLVFSFIVGGSYINQQLSTNEQTAKPLTFEDAAIQPQDLPSIK